MEMLKQTGLYLYLTLCMSVKCRLSPNKRTQNKDVWKKVGCERDETTESLQLHYVQLLFRKKEIGTLFSKHWEIINTQKA
jgi:hypothetical protein